MIHLADWTAYWAQRTPDAVALHEADTDRRWSYRHLDRRANRLARALAGACGVRRGDRVAVLAWNRGEHFEALFACAKLGALYTPLNWRLAAPELDVVLADARPEVLLYDGRSAELAARITAPVAHRVALDAASAGGRTYEALLAAGSDDPPPSPGPPNPLGEPSRSARKEGPVALEDPLMVCYTSGTTGRPKGALLSHRQLAFNSLSTQLAIRLSPDDATLVFMPLFHTGGMNCLATPLLHHGGRVVIAPSFDPERALELTARERITLHMGVPTIFQRIAESPSFRRADLSSVRTALCGGAPCPLPLIEIWRERGVLFRQGYGLTEVGPNCFSLVDGDAFRKAGSVGWPNFYLQARVVTDDGAECAPGEVGELVLGGPMVTLGYFQNPEATAASLKDGFFHTGDLARRDDEGYFYIVDRKKDMFISGGENVYPAEVEQAIAALPGVSEVCVIAVPDARWGEVGRAVVVPAPGNRLDPQALLAALDGRLARYKIPKSALVTDELPHNASGKVLRAEVKTRFGANAQKDGPAVGRS